MSRGGLTRAQRQDGIKRVARYIFENVGRQDWPTHAQDCAGYVGAALDMTERAATIEITAALGWLVK